MKIRIIVAGGRKFNNYQILEDFVSTFIKNEILKNGTIKLKREEIEIVSGRAAGPDTMGEEYSKKHGLGLALFPADWEGKGKYAGYIRNEEMAKYASREDCDKGYLLAFWDGVSRGTKNMIENAQKYGIETFIYSYKREDYE